MTKIYTDIYDIIGQTSGQLTVLSYAYMKNHRHFYRCKCTCGNDNYICERKFLVNKSIKSCGCSHKANANDIIGKQYEYLTVESVDHIEKNKYNRNIIYYKCKCKCGNTCIEPRITLTTGKATSCGCRRIEIITTSDNMSRTKFYKTWQNMKSRCYNPKATRYENYGGRGITVCDRWLDKENGFKNFKEDMYDSYLEHVEKYGEGNTSIDRIDVNGNYTKENCRWSTTYVQANNKSCNHYVNYNQESLTIRELYDKYADKRIKYDMVLNRINAGWDITSAMSYLPNQSKLVRPIYIKPIHFFDEEDENKGE